MEIGLINVFNTRDNTNEEHSIFIIASKCRMNKDLFELLPEILQRI